MKSSTRTWWKQIVEGLGCVTVAAQLLIGNALADSPQSASKRIPMRLANHSEPAPAARPARPEPVQDELGEEFEEGYDGYFDEPVDRADHFSRIWGPVWYGDCDDPCRPQAAPRCSPRWWASAEYLLWFQRGTSLPPLVTTSFQGTSLVDAGVLGLSTTSVLYGDQTVGSSSQSGGRLTLGMWLDDCQYAGVGARAFMLDSQNNSFGATTDTVPILARPYFDVTDGQTAQQNSLVIGFPNVQTGQVSVTSGSDISGGDFFLRRQIHSSNLSRVDFWLGYQYARITGDLAIASSSNESSGARLDVMDQFSTRNEYHAVALGFLTDIERDRWRCELLTKVGLGRMHQSANLSGSNTLTDGANSTTTPVGLLVRSTNRGMHSADEFSVAPELNFTWTYRLTRRLDLSVGYSFVYWTNVLTPSGVIDPNLAVNLADIPAGAQNPNAAFHDSDYWVHGVSFGLAGRF